MRRIFSRSSLLVLFAILILVITIPVHAQNPNYTPTPAQVPSQTSLPVLATTPTPTTVQFTNPNVVTFAQLQEKEPNDIVLNGPYDSDGVGIVLPANWDLKAGAQLDLLYGVSFNTDIQAQSEIVIIGGGTLSIFLDNVLIDTVQLNELGEIETNIAIPLDAFASDNGNDAHILSFVLESFETCRFYGQNTTVYIHPTSFFNLPHEFVPPSTSLVDFPRPIFQNSFIPDSALMIVPDQPSQAELKAALTTAAGLGKLSSGELTLDITTISNFQVESARNNHLIFVGKANSLPQLEDLNLPFPVTEGQFQLSNNPDNGLVEMILSPWSDSHVVLVISANTDEGIVKVAQAVSTGVLRPNRSDNFAVVEQVNLEPTLNPQALDRTLADLGYEGRTFNNRGFNAGYYDFNIPVGMSVSPESYFELVYGHSALIDYDSSQIVVLLNNQPIGSIRMSDETAKLPTNKAKIMIPPSVVKSGTNYLVVQVYLVPIDECAPPDIQGLWVNIWPESSLHIPQITAPTSPFSIQKLADFPDPFTYSPSLDTTAFVVERNDLESWRAALQIASYLGWQSSGPIVGISAYFGDELPVPERSLYNLLVVGRPNQLPIVNEFNEYLPAPFLSGSDNAEEGSSFQVNYQIPPDSPMGFLEIIQSPWNPNNVILTILGNTTQGINWATAWLLGTLRWQLAGNFAVVNDQQVFTADTTSSYLRVGNLSTPVPNAVVIPTQVGVELTHTSQQQNWIGPTLIITIVLIVFLLAFVVIRSWSRNRIQRKSDKEP